MSEDTEALLDEARHEPDGDRQWELLGQVTKAGSVVVRQFAERLLSSGDVVDIALGADLVSAMPTLTGEAHARLRAQGFSVPDTAPLSAEDRSALAALIGCALNEQSDPDALQSCVVAAGKLERPELLDAVLRHVGDADPDVREACAWSLNGLEPDGPSKRAVAALVALADDLVGEVRDWAITALGGNGIEPIDMPETRRVFREHVEDSDEEAQCEAILALAVLGDIEMLVVALERYEVGPEVVETAERLGDPRLCKPLVALRESGWVQSASDDVRRQLEDLLDAAITACCPN